jgi:hypothetical protein
MKNGGAVHDELNGAGVESVGMKWEQMFGVKEEIEAEKPEKPTKKRTTRKRPGGKKATTKKKTLDEKISENRAIRQSIR